MSSAHCGLRIEIGLFDRHRRQEAEVEDRGEQADDGFVGVRHSEQSRRRQRSSAVNFKQHNEQKVAKSSVANFDGFVVIVIDRGGHLRERSRREMIVDHKTGEFVSLTL